MRNNLVEIAFILEPEVDALIQVWIETEKKKYAQEHVDNVDFHKVLVEKDGVKFDEMYQVWKESVVRFHILKQNDAL